VVEGLRIDSSQQVSFTQYTQNSVPYFGAAGLVTELGPLTDGQLMIGSTGNAPVAASLTAGSNITITPGAGSIEIASSASGGTTWSVITSSQAAVASEGYFANGGGVVDLSLPATSAVGDTFEVADMGGNGWSVSQGAGQTIQMASTATTTGAGGSLASTAIGDWIQLVCTVANTDWIACAKSGNITIV